MSFNKQKISHFTNKLYQALTSDIRELVNQANEIRFINDNEVIATSKGDFLFEETGKSAMLTEVLITNIPYHNEGEFVCIIDKWDQNATSILQKAGLKNEQSGVDGIIFHYSQNTLTLSTYLIELKSTVNDGTLQSCIEKFEQTISRLSLFIPTISFANNINFEDIKIEFKAIIFFANRGTVMSKEDVSQTQQHLKDLYNAYHNRRINAFGKGTVQIKKTLFTFNSEAEKVKIRFIGIQDRNENPIFEEETTQNKIVIQFENMIF